jgi:hypothetical protein
MTLLNNVKSGPKKFMPFRFPFNPGGKVAESMKKT